MSDYSEVIETTSGKASYALINGTWVYTDLDANGKAEKKVFIDVKQKNDNAGQPVTTVAIAESSFDTNKGWTTTAYTTKAATFSEKDGVRTMLVDSKYKISEEDGKYTLTDAGGTSLIDEDAGTIDFEEGHNHLYGTTYGSTTDQAASVYADSYFEKMTFLGQNLMDESNHYVECSKCGITNYPVAHITSDYKVMSPTNSCTCGYTKNTNAEAGAVYFPVSIVTGDCYSVLQKYYSAVEKTDRIDEIDATGTSSTKGDEAVSLALNALDYAIEAEELGGISSEETKSDELKTFTTNLQTALTTNKTDGTTLTSALGELNLSEYSEVGGDAVVTAFEAVKTAQETNEDLSNTDLCTAVDNLAKAIVTGAKGMSKTAVESLKITNEKLESNALDHFVILRNSVLSLDFESYTTSGSKKI